jgi:hypothetical protein
LPNDFDPAIFGSFSASRAATIVLSSRSVEAYPDDRRCPRALNPEEFQRLDGRPVPPPRWCASEDRDRASSVSDAPEDISGRFELMDAAGVDKILHHNAQALFGFRH